MFFSDTAKLFLESIGRSQEVEHYLRRFRSEGGAFFALIVPDAVSCRLEFELMLFQLKSLSRLGLRPALLLTGTAVEFSQAFQHELAQSGSDVPVIVEETSMIKALHDLVAQGVRRIHFLRRRGMIANEGSSLAVCAPDEPVDAEDRMLTALAFQMLERQRDLHLSVCTPANLLKEIFTVKGAGTLFRRPTVIVHYRKLTSDQKERLHMLIEQSFGRALADVNLFDRLSDFYIEEQFTGAVLLEATQYGLYLSKFAVGVDARGSGVAQDLWQRVLAETGALFWRSRRTNSIHRWYEKIADGFQRRSVWNIYWKGVDLSLLPDLIRFAEEKAPDFVD